MNRSFLIKCAKMATLTLLASALSLGAIVPAFAQNQAASNDSEAPGFVENVVATPGDGEVRLVWDAATDNVGVTGYSVFYGTTSVVQAYLDLPEGGDPSEIQYDEVIDLENVLETTVDDLQNDTLYYFAVIAVDSAGNESLEYSEEVSATPVAATAQDDGNPPTVVSAVASRCTTVELTFSEQVVFPETNPGTAFTIEDFDTLEFLPVQNVTESPMDNTLTLTTASMNEGAQYRLTVGTAIHDDFENRMVSGASDTAVFTGVACPDEPEITTPVEETPPTDAVDANAPKLESVEIINSTELQLTFNEEVVFPEFDTVIPTEDDTTEPVDPRLALFSIFDSEKNPLEVMTVEQVENNPTILILTTAEHTEGMDYFVSVTGLLDVDGNATTGDFKSSAAYSMATQEEATSDTLAPEDVKNLASGVLDMLVSLSWESGLNSAGDLVDHYLYVSTDGGNTYEKKTNLGKDATSYSFEGGVQGQAYLFKVVAVDANGNQSEGVITTAMLPETGPALGLLAVASLLGGAGLSRKKKNGVVW